MDSLPLPEAIRLLASEARLTLDPSSAILNSGAGSPGASRYEVSVRWEKVTARQALAALLGNYHLTLVESPAGSSARIIAKPQSQAVKQD